MIWIKKIELLGEDEKEELNKLLTKRQLMKEKLDSIEFRLCEKMRSTRYIILDEVSMVSIAKNI